MSYPMILLISFGASIKKRVGDGLNNCKCLRERRKPWMDSKAPFWPFLQMLLRIHPWLRFERLLLSWRLMHHWGCLQRMAPMHASCLGPNPRLGPCPWVFFMWTSHWVLVSSTQRHGINCVTFSSYILLELTSGKFNTDWLHNWQWNFCLCTWRPWKLISRVASVHVCLWYFIWMIFNLFSFTTYCGDSCCLYSSTGKSL
jgi:hypothetical protein